MKLKIVIALAAVVGIAAYVYASNHKDKLQVSLVVPDEYIRGAVFVLRAEYEQDRVVTEIVLDDRVIETSESFEVNLPARAPWSLRGMRAELRHPKYKSAEVSVPSNPHWANQAIEIEMFRWTTNDRHTFIEPSYETSIAVLDHLRWITNDYFARSEWLLINEAVQKDYPLIGKLAYANGKKSGEWEAVRQQAITELNTLKTAIDERALQPCPEGYEVENLGYPPCGRQKVQYYKRPSAAVRKAKQDEEIRVSKLAWTDLVKRLGVDENLVRLGGQGDTVWETSALGCPEEGQSYAEEPTPGYMIAFTVKYGGTHFYHGRTGEDPFYCPEEQRTY